MIVLLRRLLVLVALLFWQGGFTFYAAVVVPVGQQELGHRRQGLITRQVTNYLNLSGTICLIPLAWDAACSGDRSRARRRGRWVCWLVLALGLALLVGLHIYLDSLLEPVGFRVLDEPSFGRAHRAYLWVSTAQWGGAIAYLVLALVAWQEEDRGLVAVAAATGIDRGDVHAAR
jgi:hypothetical protein